MHSLAWSLWNNDLSTSAWIYATEYGGKYLICYLHLIYFWKTNWKNLMQMRVQMPGSFSFSFSCGKKRLHFSGNRSIKWAASATTQMETHTHTHLYKHTHTRIRIKNFCMRFAPWTCVLASFQRIFLHSRPSSKWIQQFHLYFHTLIYIMF